MIKNHELAFWAGGVAFFSSLLAIGIFDVFDPDQWVEYLGALIVAFITGGSIYTKERYDEAKKALETPENTKLPKSTQSTRPPKPKS